MFCIQSVWNFKKVFISNHSNLLSKTFMMIIIWNVKSLFKLYWAWIMKDGNSKYSINSVSSNYNWFGFFENWIFYIFYSSMNHLHHEEYLSNKHCGLIWIFTESWIWTGYFFYLLALHWLLLVVLSLNFKFENNVENTFWPLMTTNNPVLNERIPFLLNMQMILNKRYSLCPHVNGNLTHLMLCLCFFLQPHQLAHKQEFRYCRIGHLVLGLSITSYFLVFYLPFFVSIKIRCHPIECFAKFCQQQAYQY